MNDMPDRIRVPKATPVFIRDAIAFRLGRGRTGGSTLLDIVVQLARRDGREVIVGDGDRRNPTLAALYPPGQPGGAFVPPTDDTQDMKDWITGLIGQAIEGRSSLVLDLSGGDTFLQDYGRDLALVPFCETQGLNPVALFTTGPEMDDYEHVLKIWRAGYFRPKRAVLVLNEHLVMQGRTPAGAFNAIMARPEGRELGAAGLKVMVMPRLPCMAEVRKSGLSFLDAAAGKPGPDGRPFNPVRRFMVSQWVQRVQEEIASIGAAEWMP